MFLNQSNTNLKRCQVLYKNLIVKEKRQIFYALTAGCLSLPASKESGISNIYYSLNLQGDMCADAAEVTFT
ncbi:hypothetical protein DDR33_21155 [Pararcticibacter amylolyticus]|uniref:Uncharacterized protein n=1 Tax=Pararcticibacter amylolyticus TaxID=2173175 RepID=A0A2U2PBF8_9SPHI|nr:hypothetical protein DDR33_21155 [Pararcticibacter amylolyticus]